MERLAGIKMEKDSRGRNRYLRIDLKQRGNNELLEEFLGELAVKNHVKSETITLEEFNKYIDKN